MIIDRRYSARVRGGATSGSSRMPGNLENVMKNLLLAAAAATMVFAVAPAFAASPADDAEQGYSVYPSPGTCHFVKQQVVLPNGHVIFQTHQVCN
jgi:hypothetical protein